MNERIKRFFAALVLRALRVSCTHRACRWARPLLLWVMRWKYRVQISTLAPMRSFSHEWIELDSGNGRLAYALPQHESTLHPLVRLDAAPNYLAVLHQATVLAESSLVIASSGEGLSEMMLQGNPRRLKFEGNKGYECLIGPHKVCTLFSKAPAQQIERGVMISGNYSFNYYHLTFEIMPRLMDLDRHVPVEVPLLVDQAMLRYDQYRQLLDWCNESHRPLVVLESDRQTKVGTLYYPSVASYMIPNLQTGFELECTDFLFDTRSLEWLRKVLLRHKSDRVFGEKIFLYRKGGLRLFNQDEVFERLADRGYTKVSTEDLSLADQMALFSGAREIVAGSGAALTNILYCSAGCKIRVVVNARYETATCFSSVASFVGARMRYVSAGVDRGNDLGEAIHADFRIDPKTILDALDE